MVKEHATKHQEVILRVGDLVSGTHEHIVESVAVHIANGLCPGDRVRAAEVWRCVLCAGDETNGVGAVDVERRIDASLAAEVDNDLVGSQIDLAVSQCKNVGIAVAVDVAGRHDAAR